MKSMLMLMAMYGFFLTAGDSQRNTSIIENYADWALRREMYNYRAGNGYCGEIPTGLVAPSSYPSKSAKELEEEVSIILGRKLMLKYVITPIAMSLAAGVLVVYKSLS